MLLRGSNRHAQSTSIIVLVIVVVLAAFALLVAAAVFNRPNIPASGAGGTVVGSGKVVTRELQFSDFRTIRVQSVFQVEITYSGSYRVRVTMDDNLFDHLLSTKEGEVLTIGLKPGYEYHWPQSLTPKAEIQLPDLNDLQIDGAARGTVRGFSSSHRLMLHLSGATSVEIADTTAGDVEAYISAASKLSGSMTANGNARFTISAASTVTLGGRADSLEITGSGSCNLELSNFKVHNAKINLSGASQATIDLDGRLDADLSGASKLIYIGNATLGDINVTGGSTITKQ